MARIVKDRIKQPSTTTGTGTITLSGSVAGFQAFSVLGNGSTTFYCIEDANGIAFEVGIGTYTGNTLARTTILESSNGGNAISLTSGTHTAFVTYPAERAGFNDEGLSPTLTASGTITAGKPVIQNTNGTVTQVAETTTPDANPTFARGNITSTSNTSFGSLAYEATSGRHAYLYKDTGNSGYNTVVAGVWSSGAMTWGTPTVVASAGSASDNNSTICAGNGAIYVQYKQGSYTGMEVKASTISGTTFTFGSSVNFSSAGGSGSGYEECAIGFDESTNYIIACYSYNDGGGSETYLRPLTASGTTLTVGSTEYSIYNSNGGVNRTNLIYDPDTSRVVLIYCDSADGDKGKSKVIQSTGSAGSPTLTVGSAVTWASQGTGKNDIIYDTANNRMFVSSYKQESGVDYWKGCIGTVTGGGTNSISWTAQSIVWQPSGGNASTFASTYDSSVNKGYIWFRENSVMKYNTIAIGTSSFTMGTLANLPDSTDQLVWNGRGAVYNSANGTLLAGRQYGGSTDYSAWLSSFTATTTSSNLTPTNYLGLASNSATTTNPVQINVNGSINNAQTSLTVDKDYYTTGAGSIVTRLNGSGVVQATQFVGTALSATALELKTFPASTIVGKADGTVTKGKPVIVEADGDFAQISATGNSGTEINAFTSTAAGGGTNSNPKEAVSTSSDGAGTFCFVYKNAAATSYPVAQLGTSNAAGAITYGTQVVLESATYNFRHAGIVYNPDYNSSAGGFIISAQKNSVGRSVTFGISYSGTTITNNGSTEIYTNTSDIECIDIGYDTTNDKAYVWFGKPESAMSTVTNSSGTTLTNGGISGNYAFGSASGRMQFGNMVYDNTNNRGTIFYRDEGNSDYPTAMAYTVSGDSFTYGTAKVLESSACYHINGAEGEADSKGTICVFGNGDNTTLKSTVLSYSGTTITNGAIVSILANTYLHQYQHLTYNKVSKNYLTVITKTSSNDYPQIIIGTYSSGAITWGSPIALDRNSYTWTTAIITETGNAAQNFWLGNTSVNDNRGGIYASAYDNSVTNLTAENYIGIAQETVSTGNDVKVTTISGVDANQSSLTPAQIYYVQTDGTLSTTAGSPSVVAGTAIASTQLLVSRS